MKRITKYTTFHQLSKIKEFKPFYKYLTPQRILRKGIRKRFVTIRRYEEVWETGPIVEGLNHLRDLVNSEHQVFYNLSSKEEIEKDPSLAERVLFHLPVEKKAKFVFIVPGGGYSSVIHFSSGIPFGKRLNDMGYHVFFVNYRIEELAKHPNPIDDLAKGLEFVVKNADKLNVDIGDYALMGVSAGGHAAAAFGLDNIGYAKYDLPKPGAMILVYPVITMGELSHVGSRKYFMGDDINNTELEDLYSVEKQVGQNYPPTFVWQCVKDEQVPIENTRMLAEALEKHQVPFIYESYDDFGHGWGLAETKAAKGWLERSIAFWQENI